MTAGVAAAAGDEGPRELTKTSSGRVASMRSKWETRSTDDPAASPPQPVILTHSFFIFALSPTCRFRFLFFGEAALVLSRHNFFFLGTMSARDTSGRCHDSVKPAVRLLTLKLYL